jgi:hypothetical protein
MLKEKQSTRRGFEIVTSSKPSELKNSSLACVRWAHNTYTSVNPIWAQKQTSPGVHLRGC